jgi:hypothetical protein
MIEQIFRHRIDIVRQQLLAPLKLDLLLVYSDDTLKAGAVRYLTDFDIYAMYALAVVPPNGDVALAFGLHHSAYLVRVKENANADYYLGTYLPGDLCSKLLRDCGRLIDAPRIGMVGGKDMFRKIDTDLRQTFPDAAFLDVDVEFWSCIQNESTQSRADRTSRLQRSAAILGETLLIAEERWRDGNSPSEIAAQVGLTARKRGADVLNREMASVSLATGLPLPPFLNGDASNIVASSDAFTIDIRVAYGGINTSASRTFVREKADIDLEGFRNKHRDVCRRLKTGTAVNDILDAAIELSCIESTTNAQDADLGGAIGFSAQEEPRLRYRGNYTVVDGSTIVVATRTRHPRLGTIRFSDTVLVTQSTGKILTETTKI